MKKIIKSSWTNIEYFYLFPFIYLNISINIYLYDLTNYLWFLLSYMACEFIYCLPIDF